MKGLQGLYVLVIAALLQGACVLPGATERNGSEGAEGLPFPANFNATAMSPSSVYLVWDQVEGIETYAVFISNRRNSGYELVDETEERSFTDNSLNPSTTYYYKVAAVSADGTGPLSDPAQARTLEEGTTALLPPPGGVIASALSPVSVRISWNAVSGAAYNLYRAGSAAGEKAKLNASPLSTTSYTDTGLTQSTSYYYFLRSLNADNAEGPWSPVIQVSTQSNIDPDMPVPANLNAAASGFTAIQVTWNTVSEAVGYNLYVSSASGGPYIILASPGASPYLHDNLDPGQTRYYRISALRANGRESPQSAAKSGSTQALPVPAGLAAEALGADEIRLTWNSVTEADSYKVYGSSALNGTYTLIDTVSGSTYTHSGLNQNTTYYYKVAAELTVSGTPLEGGQSAAVSAKTPRAPVTPPGATLAQQLAYIAGQADDGETYDITVAGDVGLAATAITTMGRDVTIHLHSPSAGDIKTVSLSASTGYLFTVSNNITLKLENIKLLGSSGNNVALIRVGSGGTLVLDTDAEITGNTITTVDTKGAGVFVDGGTLTMLGGRISGNNSSQRDVDGGAVHVGATGRFTMYGGTISDNKVTGGFGYSYHDSRGGGVYIAAGGYFAKIHLSTGEPSGVIYGNDAGEGLANFAFANYTGHAVYYDTGEKVRNTTLGGYDEISTENVNIGWE